MQGTRIVGFVLLIAGIALLLFGLNAADSVAEQVRETVTGRFSTVTTWYIIGGIAAIVGGCVLALFGKSSTT